MKCIYCYEEDKTSEYTWDEIKSTLDGIVKYNKKFALEFLGGEPCLRTDLMCQVVDYLESFEDVEVTKYIITTNGTIINGELIDLLKNNKRVVWAASIDGTRFGNFMRVMKDDKNSYDTVIKNFKTLQQELGDDTKQLGCHMVTHPYNIGYYVDGVVNLYNQGFRFIDIGIVENTMIIDDQYCKEFLRQNEILSDMIKSGKLPGVEIGLFNSLRPKKDSKHYIKDDSGKVILETFGRADGDIKDSDEYKTQGSYSELGTMIPDIREKAYNYHNR